MTTRKKPQATDTPVDGSHPDAPKRRSRTPRDEAAAPKTRRGIQSIEVGFGILDALRVAGGPIPLRQIAERTGLAVANVHYYLVSFQAVGVVRQEPDTGFYGLGPYALRLGMAALEQFDVFTAARPVMADLASTVGHTIFLGVWGNRGPTIVYRIESGRGRPILELRVGTVLPLLSSALGRNFLAHLPDALTRELVSAYMKLPAAQRYGITTWALRDRDSWLRRPPRDDGRDSLVLFDDWGQPTAMFAGFVEGLDG